MADIIAIWLYAKCGGICLPLLFYSMADGIATLFWVLNWIADRCYCQCGRWESHFVGVVADVIAIVADRITTLLEGWCYCHCGRWNSHIGWNVVKADLIAFVADGIATGSPILVWVLVV